MRRLQGGEGCEEGEAGEGSGDWWATGGRGRVVDRTGRLNRRGVGYRPRFRIAARRSPILGRRS